MRKWWKKVGMIAGGLLGLGGLLAPVHAQFPGMGGPPPAGGGVFAADPQPPCPPEFLKDGPGEKGPPPSPFEFTDPDAANAFNDCDVIHKRPYCLTFRAEYLNWRVNDARLSANLFTTTTGTPDLFDNTGNLLNPNTSLLLGAGDYNYDRLHGWRGTVGMALHILPPIELTAFQLNDNKNLLEATSGGEPGSPLISRPVQLVNFPGQLGFPTEDVYFVTFPELLKGGADVDSLLRFWGLETNFLLPVGETDYLQIYLIGGYRHVELEETLTISTTTSPIAPALLNFVGDPEGFGEGTTISIQDRFRTHNRFDGGQFGIRSILTRWNFSLFLDTKLAVGNTTRLVDVAGSSTIFTGNNTLTVGGGVLALPSNIGRITDRTTSIIPEGNLTLSYQVHPNVRFFGGYNVLYWSRIVRPGNQISSLIDTQQVPTDETFIGGYTGTNPTRQFNEAPGGFFAHGFNFGLEIGF